MVMDDALNSSDDDRPASGSLIRDHWPVAALVALVFAAYFLRLTALPVCGEESRWAGAAREMIATGDWVTPRQQGTLFPERPPLGSWAMALVGLVRGRVDLVAIRLPTVLATLAMTLGIFAYARCWLSRTGSLAAAVAYATFGQVLQIGRLGESEALFTLFVGGALLAWHAGYMRRRNPVLVWCVGYALAALGALVKGPQAPVYFAAACTAFLVVKRDWRWLLGWGHAAGLACFAAIVGAWFVPFALGHWTAIDDIWAGLAQDRFTLDGLAKHVASYPLETFGCLLPWSPLLFVLAVPRVFRAVLAQRPQIVFLLVALAVTYPTVWLAAGARGRYYMPLYPLVAVLVGLAVEYCTSAAARPLGRAYWKHFQRGLAITVGVIGAGVVAGSLVAWDPLAKAAQPPTFLWLWIPGVSAASGLLVWCSRGLQSWRPQVAVLALGGFLALAASGVMINARLRGANNIDPRLAAIKQQLPAGQLVSLGRVYHRFAYSYETPIEQIPWPETAGQLPPGVEYFCFDRRPTDTAEARSTSDGRLSSTTSGTLPFEWEEVAEIACDPVHRDVPSRTVVIGRVRRQPSRETLLARPAARTTLR
ncbi:MAG: hypothetical protein DWQ37_10355 [Planctomycetota bacterium]|nr:MAG: hypothetical protein DWQ37_10355 [Planctomycetota bacterium]